MDDHLEENLVDSEPAFPVLGSRGISRRDALIRLTMAGVSVCGGGRVQAFSDGEAKEEITFFVMADPQIHLDKWGTAGTEQTLRVANELPGKPFPFGGKVAVPKAVIVAGDLVDVVQDPRHWETYKRFFDPNGNALLRFRAFEGIGNHDLAAESAEGFSSVQKEFVARNRSRKGEEVFHYDEEYYHYSWDWGPLHLINLNLFPGNQPRPVYDNEAPWNNPRRSLDFLKADLEKQVGGSGRPVILWWHYGLRGWGLEKWWTPDDLEALKRVIEPYNVVLILHGHEHAFAHYKWENYPVFMCPSPQLDRDPKTPDVPSKPKGFLVVRLKGDQLQLAHHGPDGWKETWSRSVNLGNT
jgi:hypothetical protein